MTPGTPHRDRTPGTPTDAERITIIAIAGLVLFPVVALLAKALL